MRELNFEELQAVTGAGLLGGVLSDLGLRLSYIGAQLFQVASVENFLAAIAKSANNATTPAWGVVYDILWGAGLLTGVAGTAVTVAGEGLQGIGAAV